MKLLLTGGAGFIGHHFVERVLGTTDWSITILDRLDHSGNLNRLAEIGAADNPRVRYVYHDLRAALNPYLTDQVGAHDYVVHMAGGTHVDRSIANPVEFVYDNVVGTCNLLDFVRHTACRKMLYFSTDEVFGPAPPGVLYKEWDRYNSGNPYAATKAGGEELCLAFGNTYQMPIVISHTMNVLGLRQAPEKYVPSCISKIEAGETVVIHANKERTRAGSRFYISAVDVADAVLFLLENGVPGDKYNVVGNEETDNLELAQMVARCMGKPLKHELVDFHSSRPGHDLRYSLCGEKMLKMGWKPRLSTEATIRWIVAWSLQNRHWVPTRLHL